MNNNGLEDYIFTVYIKAGCPWCDKAKMVLEEILEIEKISWVDVTKPLEHHEALKEETGHRTVPAILIGEHFIGGYDDLIRELKSGSSLMNKVLRAENEKLKKQVARLKRSL